MDMYVCVCIKATQLDTHNTQTQRAQYTIFTTTTTRTRVSIRYADSVIAFAYITFNIAVDILG